MILKQFMLLLSHIIYSKGTNMEESNSSEYSNRMIEAFIDKPEVSLWYQNAFATFNVNGVDAMKWKWSWWACFSGFLFLLYRKQYTASLFLFIASISIGLFFPFSIILMILSGGYSTYFIYKGYKKKLKEIEAIVPDEEKRIETMRAIGGYNQWVVWVYGVLVTLIFLGIISAILIPKVALSQ